jgi:UTP--glucose-1-phosphate uridylyltransferase
LLRRYFTEEPIWYERLQNKAEAKAALEEVDLLSKRIRFVEQAEQLGLGHAVLQAAPLLKGEDEPILILLGDALVLSSTPCACEMAEISRENNGASVVGLEQVPDEKVSRYGIVAGKKLENPNVLKLTGLIEKPSLEEIQLTDAISSLLQEIPVLGFQYPGKRYDIGNPQGYLETLNAFAGSKS